MSWSVSLGAPALHSENELSSSELSSIVSSKVILGGRANLWGLGNFRSPFLLMWIHGQSVEQSQDFSPSKLPRDLILYGFEIYQFTREKVCSWGPADHTCVLIFILRMFCFFPIFKGHIWAVFFNYRPWTISEMWNQFIGLPSAFKKEKKNRLQYIRVHCT